MRTVGQLFTRPRKPNLHALNLVIDFLPLPAPFAWHPDRYASNRDYINDSTKDCPHAVEANAEQFCRAVWEEALAHFPFLAKYRCGPIQTSGPTPHPPPPTYCTSRCLGAAAVCLLLLSHCCPLPLRLS